MQTINFDVLLRFGARLALLMSSFSTVLRFLMREDECFNHVMPFWKKKRYDCIQNWSMKTIYKNLIKTIPHVFTSEPLMRVWPVSRRPGRYMREGTLRRHCQQRPLLHHWRAAHLWPYHLLSSDRSSATLDHLSMVTSFFTLLVLLMMV